MAPRAAAAPLTRVPIDTLPPGEGRQLPHNGYSAEDCAKAQARGFIPVDVRWERGQIRVDLIGQGLIIGSVVLNDSQMTAYEAEVKLYKETRPVEKAPAALTEDIRDRLADIRAGKLANILMHKPQPQVHNLDPLKKLTQPAGPSEKLIADEIKQLMEKA